MAGVGVTPDELAELRGTAAVILAAGLVGFLILGLVALMLSRRFLGNVTGLELLGAGVVGMATAIFLSVALIAVWFNKGWVGRWHD